MLHKLNDEPNKNVIVLGNHERYVCIKFGPPYLFRTKRKFILKYMVDIVYKIQMKHHILGRWGRDWTRRMRDGKLSAHKSYSIKNFRNFHVNAYHVTQKIFIHKNIYSARARERKMAKDYDVQIVAKRWIFLFRGTRCIFSHFDLSFFCSLLCSQRAQNIIHI